MSHLELNEQPTSESGKNAEEQDDNDAGDYADDGQAGGQAEHAVGDNLGYH